MRVKVFPWVGKEFIALSAEGRPALSPDEAVRDLLDRFHAELNEWGLSLEHSVRSRLWARDRAARDLGSRERVKILSGEARSASSSFIAPSHFDSEANVGLDLLAMRPAAPPAEKVLQEYEPPITPLRYLIYDSVIFLSGVTWEKDGLQEQLENILPRIGASLQAAGSSWPKAVRMSCFLHRSQQLGDLKSLLAALLGADLPLDAEYTLVEGYSAPGKLIEIEVTAVG